MIRNAIFFAEDADLTLPNAASLASRFRDYAREERLGAPLILVLIYILLEYGRPYSLIPIGPLRPALWVSLALALFWVKTPNKGLRDPIIIGIGIFILIMAKGIPFAWNNYWAYKMTEILVIYLFTILLPITRFVDNHRRLKVYITTWIGIHIFTAVLAIQKGGKGVGGILSDENDFALAINIALPYAFFMFQEARSKFKKAFFAAALFIYTLACMFTFSRGGFLGLVSVVAFCLMSSPNKIRNILALAVLGVALFLVMPQGYEDEVKSIFADSTLERDQRQGRIYLWKVGFEIFLDKPIMGCGAGGYKFIVGEYEDLAETHRRHSGKVAHSVYFTLLPELGIPGALVFMYLIYQLFRNFFSIRYLEKNKYMIFSSGLFQRHEIALLDERIRYISYVNLGVTGGAVAFLSTGVFLSVLYYPHIWITLALAVAVKRSLQNELSNFDVFNKMPQFRWGSLLK